jgi:hypothetical protein
VVWGGSRVERGGADDKPVEVAEVVEVAAPPTPHGHPLVVRAAVAGVGAVAVILAGRRVARRRHGGSG